MTDKQTEALKLALEALESCSAGDYSTGHVIHPSFDLDAVNKAIEAIDALAEQPAPPPECQTEAEKTAFAFGWFKALEQKRKADSALELMAENARELGLDYEPPCKTGSQCTSKCQQCEQPEAELKATERQVEILSDELSKCSKELAALKAQQQNTKRWAVFCSECRKEWSVSYQHPGKSICAECDAKAGAQQQEPVGYVRPEVLAALKRGVRWGGERLSPRADEEDGLTAPIYTSPQSKPWVGLTEQERNDLEDYCEMIIGKAAFEAIEAKLREKNA